MSIRSITEADIPRLTTIAARGMEFDEFNELLLLEKTVGALDYLPELGLAYEVGGEVLGFAQGAMGQLEKNKGVGYVRLMAVDRAHRRAGIGTALLHEMEMRLKDKCAVTVQMFDCPHNYMTPGVDFRYTEAYCFLHKHKYEMYRENHNLLCNLDVNTWPELDAEAASHAKEGIEIRRAQKSDLDSINAFLNEHWPAWRFEVHASLENDPVSLYIGIIDGKTVAFSAYQGNNRSLSWFGPMGTSPILRGKGIGQILLRLCLRDLARQGWKTAIIPWVGPIPFYTRYCGAWIDRCFWAWKKELA